MYAWQAHMYTHTHHTNLYTCTAIGGKSLRKMQTSQSTPSERSPNGHAVERNRCGLSGRARLWPDTSWQTQWGGGGGAHRGNYKTTLGYNSHKVVREPTEGGGEAKRPLVEDRVNMHYLLLKNRVQTSDKFYKDI